MSLLAVMPLADSDAGKGSPIGLFVVLLLVVATYLLYRSMARHIRRVPERFPGQQATDEPLAEPIDEPSGPNGGPDAAAGSGSPAAESSERTGPS